LAAIEISTDIGGGPIPRLLRVELTRHRQKNANK